MRFEKMTVRNILMACTASMIAGYAGAAPHDDLHRLFDETWERDLRRAPLMATYVGDRRYNDRWGEFTLESFAREHAENQRTLLTLGRIARASLDADDQLDYDLFKREMETRIRRYAFKPWAYEMTMREGPQRLDEVAEIMPFETVADFDNWLMRMRALPDYLRQYETVLRAMMVEGRTQPRPLMQRALASLAQQIDPDIDAHPFMGRFKRIPNAIPAAERVRLADEARHVVGEAIIPAYRRFEAFFREEYLPRCREAIGISATPDGNAHYAERAAHHTTTAMSPDEIHRIGLREVERILREMQALMDQVGFKGTRQQFFEFLRTDPQFYFSNPDDLFRAYVYTTKTIEPELPKLFGKLYRSPVGVRPIPAGSAPTTTTAYYNPPSIDGKRAGYFYANLYKPEARPKYEIEVLTAHEAVPGHHLQIAIAQERTEVPKFRRFSYVTAFVEGWGLYAERLGFDLGLYKDPYSHFGMLTYDMWRAVRLVVDTGMHVKNWSRQEAIDYFRAHAAKTETDIVNEIDRYIGWPGQALAYKIGQLKILELRRRAEMALGAKFDIRVFHDMLLADGALPLDILERRVEAWIRRQK